MANKIDIPVVINGKVYTLSGYEGEDYLQNVATYINGKIADDYFKAKNQADNMAAEDTTKEQQLYDLRHEVIEAQIKQESALKMIEEYKEQIHALQRKIIQLESEKGRND